MFGASEIIARLGLDTAKFDRGMRSAQGSVKKFAGAIRQIVGFGGGAVFAALSRNAINMASRIDDASKKLGVGAEFLQAFGFAARETGVKTEAAEMGLQRFSRRVGEARQGLGELKGVLQQYNIALENNDGTARDITDVLKDYANVIRDTQDPQERLRLAFKAFDSEGAGLVTMLQNGADGLDEWIEKANKANQVMDGFTIAQLAQAENLIEQTQTKATIAVGEILAAFTEPKAFEVLLYRLLGVLGTFGGKWADMVMQTWDMVGRVGVATFGYVVDQFRDKFLMAVTAIADKMNKVLPDKFKIDTSALASARTGVTSLGDQVTAALARSVETDFAEDFSNFWSEKADDAKMELMQAFNAEHKTRVAQINAAKAGEEGAMEVAKANAEFSKKVKAALTVQRDKLASDDPGRMTLRELANIGRFSPGISTDTSNAGASARDILDIEKRAEKARKEGRVDEAVSLFDKAEKERVKLFSTGQLSSKELSEGSLNNIAAERITAADLDTTLKTGNETLGRIEELLKAERKYQ